MGKLKNEALEIDGVSGILPDSATFDERRTASDGEARYLYDRRSQVNPSLGVGFPLCIPGYPHLKIALRMLYGVSSLLFRLLIPTTANSAIIRERMVLGFVGVGRNNLAQS